MRELGKAKSVDSLPRWGLAVLRPYKSRKSPIAKPQGSQTLPALQGMYGVGGLVFFGDAFGMAILAFDKVDVVRALRRGEGGVHLFNVDAAIREARMTGGAGRARALAVFLVAR